MLRLRPQRDTARQNNAILISDSGQFISQTRLLLSASEAQNLLAATTIDEAIRLIQIDSCYCALVDNAFAGGTGIQAVGRLRRELGWPSLAIPVILIAEQATMQTIRRAVLEGVDEVISVPLTPETLDGRMLATRLRPRRFVSSAGYDGPCRRGRGTAPLVASELRRADDVHPSQLRRLAREVHVYMVVYHATQRAIQLLSTSMLHNTLVELRDAANDVYEAALPLQDARVESLAWLCQTLAASPGNFRRDPTLLHGTLRDLLALVEHRLQRTANRLQKQPRRGASQQAAARPALSGPSA